MKNDIAKFSDLDSWMLVATFFTLWLAVFFESSIEDFLAYLFIFSFGILHGANDIRLLQKSQKRESQKKGCWAILSYYTVFVIVVALLFYLIPLLALVLFIVFSGYHFGEQHWAPKFEGVLRWSKFFYATYGLFILLLLFYAHSTEVSEIILQITEYGLHPSVYAWAALITGMFFVVQYLIYFRQAKTSWFLELFYLCVFFVVFKTASLLWAFAIYFIIWHSIPSLADQIKFLYGDTSLRNFFKYVKSAAIYWMISIVGLVGLFFLVGHIKNEFLPLFFSFLAAITFPHVFVINKLNRH